MLDIIPIHVKKRCFWAFLGLLEAPRNAIREAGGCLSRRICGKKMKFLVKWTIRVSKMSGQMKTRRN